MIRRFFLLLTFIIFAAGCSSNSAPTQGTYGGKIVSAWYPDFELVRASQSLEAAGDILTEISPVWFVLDEKGAIRPLHMANDQKVINMARANGIKIIPSILNFQNGTFQTAPVLAIIQDASTRRAHAQAVAKLVKDFGYDGIDLDYEGLPASAMANFTALVGAVREALPEDKILAIAVHAKHSSAQNWNGPGAQDWRALLQRVDRFRIMIYDYHWATSGPGPIAPLDWMGKVLNYALSQARDAGISSQKIIAGMPFYGYNWGSSPPAREANYHKVSALRNDKQNQILSETRDGSSGEPVLRYRRDGVDHTVYYQDAASIQGRLNILKRDFPQIGGIAYWRLGAEDPRAWAAIRAYRLNQ